jgi:hypothetical protein
MFIAAVCAPRFNFRPAARKNESPSTAQLKAIRSAVVFEARKPISDKQKPKTDATAVIAGGTRRCKAASTGFAQKHRQMKRTFKICPRINANHKKNSEY